MIVNGKRELCYVVKIDNIQSIEGSDNCECAVIGGWHVMVKKDTFKIGDIAIYFEIDSKVPETEPFKFLEKKHYKIKTQKYTFGGKGRFISQGLLMSFKDFPNIFEEDLVSNNGWLYKVKNYDYKIVEIGQPLTNLLNVKYSVAEDNKRKSVNDKYKYMVQRHEKLFKKSKIIKWLYSKKWGKNLLFFFLGNKKDVKKAFWPDWVVKTDEERVQNLPNLFPPDDTKWIVTEKIDGSSTTFTMKRKNKKYEFYVCSRNVCFDTPKKEEKLFYDTNIYTEMAEKYNIKQVLTNILDLHEELEFVTLQGETYGKGVQKKEYGIENHDFAAFNLILGDKRGARRLNPIEMTNILKNVYNIPCVPIVDYSFKLPQTIDEMVEYADGESVLDGSAREGVVLRTIDGVNSFKAVSNNYLLEKGE